MHSYLTELVDDKKIFIGDYDSYTIIKENIDVSNLLMLTKSAMLLFDRILLPSAFFWQSNEMVYLLPMFEEAISQGYILPMIRDRSCTIDIYDYFERRLEESNKQVHLSVFQKLELASEIAGNNNKRTVSDLQSINTFAYVDGKSIRDTYIENWTNDIKNHHDINSINLLLYQSDIFDTQRKSILHFLLEETHNPNFSRAGCIDAIEKNIPDLPIRRKICQRASFLYLKSNADAYGSHFFISNNQYNGMVFEDNLLLLSKTLRVIGITPDTIKNLSLHDIICIKNSSEYQSFIKTYYEIVNKTYLVQSDIVQKISQKMNRELLKEKSLRRSLKVLNWIQKFSSTIFVGLLVNYFSSNNISFPLLSITGGSCLAISIIKHIGKINKYINSASFLDFKNYILQKRYKKNIDNRIGELD